MLSYGFNRRIVKNRNWEISAIYDVVFKAVDLDMSNSWLFSTYYPTFDDMKLIIAVGVNIVSFMGEINDAKSVELANILSENSISLELRKIELSKFL